MKQQNIHRQHDIAQELPVCLKVPQEISSYMGLVKRIVPCVLGAQHQQASSAEFWLQQDQDLEQASSSHHTPWQTRVSGRVANLVPFVCQWDPVDNLHLSGLLALNTGQCLADQAVWQGHTLPALLLPASI